MSCIVLPAHFPPIRLFFPVPSFPWRRRPKRNIGRGSSTTGLRMSTSVSSTQEEETLSSISSSERKSERLIRRPISRDIASLIATCDLLHSKISSAVEEFMQTLPEVHRTRTESIAARTEISRRLACARRNLKAVERIWIRSLNGPITLFRSRDDRRRLRRRLGSSQQSSPDTLE